MEEFGDLVWPILGFKVMPIRYGGYFFAQNGHVFHPGDNVARCHICESPTRRRQELRRREAYFGVGRIPDMFRLPELGGEPPVQEHRCGLHSFFKLEDAINYKAPGIIGVTISWGRVLFDEDWMRARYQRVVALGRIPHPNTSTKTWRGRMWEINTRWLERTSIRYETPILPLDVLEEYGLQYGQKFQI